MYKLDEHEPVTISTIDSNFKKQEVDFPWVKVPLDDMASFMINHPGIYDRDFISDILEFSNICDGEFLFDMRDEESPMFIGWVFIVKEFNRVQPLFVVLSYRGMGFGKILMKDAIEHFNADNLNCFYTNKIAMKLYRDLGFMMSKKHRNVITMKLIKRSDNNG